MNRRSARIAVGLAALGLGCDAFVVSSDELDGDGDGLAIWEDCDDQDPDVGGPPTWYLDADSDGYPGSEETIERCTQPSAHGKSWYLGSQTTIGGWDCEDKIAAVHPGADEVCDGIDNNCNGLADVDDPTLVPGEATLGYLDQDEDGHGDADLAGWYCAPFPAGVVARGDDCDDSNSEAHPGAIEVCDGDDVDEDCNGWADDLDPQVAEAGKLTWSFDWDGDGFGAEDDTGRDPKYATHKACDAETGFVAQGGDCDDLNPAVHPDAQEVCDDLDTDEDCDGAVDDADGSVSLADASSWYLDDDQDGFGGWESEPEAYCDDPSTVDTRYSTDNTDCNDDPATGEDIHPYATEVCDPADVDEDCSGFSDDADPNADAGTKTPYYVDADGDGYGASGSSGALYCDSPGALYSLNDGDCDDTRADISPSEVEICDPANEDEDCNAAADDADPGALAGTKTDYYPDGDGDGYGDSSSAAQAFCDDPSAPGAAFVTDATDCDDDATAVNPGATEVCDADDTDEDCSGLADDDDAGTDSATKTLYYDDGDNDGFGNLLDSGTRFCDAPAAAYSDNNQDCDDSNGAVHPNATEVCDTSDVDEDCNGLADDDDSGVDIDTLFVFYPDSDADGYGDQDATAQLKCDDPATPSSPTSTVNTDCDDGDPSIHPNAVELCDADDTDEDCNGVADDADSGVDAGSLTVFYPDDDEDGYGDQAHSGVSFCDNPSGAPGTQQYVTDNTDCDEGSDAVNPGAEEVCDEFHAIDEDCNGEVDDGDGGLYAEWVAYSAGSGGSTNPYSVYYQDSDGDGFGNQASTFESCEAPSGYVDNGEDCNDTRAAVHPNATEICDHLDTDNDCNGVAEDADGGLDTSTQSTYYLDSDGDGYGDAGQSVDRCEVPSGYVSNDRDCDDDDAATNPTKVWYADEDGDGQGFAAYQQVQCAQPVGYVDNESDCDDQDPLIYDAAPERCNGVDDDCNGSIDYGSSGTDETDLDGDSYVICTVDTAGWLGSSTIVGGSDCNDDPFDADAASVHPNAEDECGDGVDWGCDGLYHCGAAGLEQIVGLEAYDRWGRPPLVRDVTGDGHGDLVLGARLSDGVSGTGNRNGALFILESNTTAGYDLASPLAAWHGSNSDNYAGQISASMGDQDNDGDDSDTWIAVAASRHDGAYTNGGALFVIDGTLSGTLDLDTDAQKRFTGGGSNDLFAHWVAGPYDFDGDGFDDDLIAGAYRADTSSLTDAGKVYLLHGPLSSLGSGSSVAVESVATVIAGSNANDELGSAVSGADVDGDGISDALLAATDVDTSSLSNVGAVYLFLGTNLGSGPLDADGDADAAVLGEATNDELGWRMSGIGDLDGDGYEDVGIGVSKSDTYAANAGSVAVFYGATGATPWGGRALTFSDADWRLYGSDDAGRAGGSVVGVGDADGDGLDDFAVGAYQGADPDGAQTGKVYMLLGALTGTGLLSDAEVMVWGGQSGSEMGYFLGAGDRNADGLGDLLIGVHEHDDLDAGENDVGAYYLLDGTTELGD